MGGYMGLRNDIKEHAQVLSRRLGVEQAALEKILAFWIVRYPSQEREDGLQSLTLALLEKSPGHSRPCVRGMPRPQSGLVEGVQLPESLFPRLGPGLRRQHRGYSG